MSTTANFLSGGGEMGAIMRAHDWSRTPLGAPETWPQSLRTVVRLMLNTGHPMYIFWGADGRCFYNDAYRASIGAERHPGSLGLPARDVWEEIWPIIGPQIDQVMSGGGATWHENALVPITRDGVREDVYWTYSYSPIDDEGSAGGIGGVLVTCNETTHLVLAERDAEAARVRQREMLQQMPGFVCVLGGPNHVYEYVNDAYIKISGSRDFIGRTVREVFPELKDQGFYELLDQVYASGERYVARGLPIQFADEDGLSFIDFVYEPIRDALGDVTGIFVGGYDVTDVSRTAESLAESESRYRTLFDSVGSGFCIIEMKFDTAGKPVDYRIVEANTAFADMTGLHDANGKWVSEVAPGLEQHWFDLYGQVALTGQPARFENPADIFGRWYDVEAVRIGNPAELRVAILFNDITAQKQAELRRQVLLDLNDAVRDLTDPADIAHASSSILAEALKVSRVGYGVMDTTAETVTIERDYNAPGVQSIAGVIHFRDFGSYIENLSRGEVVVFDDAAADPRISDGGAALAGIKATALINLPLLEQGKVVALLFVNNATPRAWSDGDVALVREVAERVRTATERARASAALRENEARLRFLDDLNVEVSKLTDADAILEVTTRMTARHLAVTNCAYADMDEDQDGFTIRGDWAAKGTASIVGHYSLADFGALAVQELGAGRPLIINDNLKEIAPHEAATFQSIGIAATICMPLVKAGRLTALMAIHHAAPHRWTNEELATIREVTERSWAHVERGRADMELRDSEERYRTLFDTIDEGFCLIEFVDGPHGPMSDYVHVDANPAAAEQVGLSNVKGRSIREIAGDAAQPWVDTYGEVLRTGDPIRFEREFEETGRWLELAAFRVEPPSRNQVAVVFKDLTERKRAETALRESEAQFRAFAQAVPNHVWASHPDGRLYWFNEQVYLYAGVEEGSLDGAAGWGEIVHPEDLPGAGATWARSLATGETYHTEFRIRRVDGAWRWFAVRAEAVRDADGSIIRWVGANIDIDDIRHQGAELERVNGILSDLLAGTKAERDRLWTLSEDMLARADYAGGLLAVNPAWTKILGWSEHDLLTNPYADIINPDNIEATTAALARMGETGQPTRFENRILSKDGEWTPIGWTVAPEPDGVHFIAVGRDLTEDKARERQLLQAQEALRQSQKMEAVGQLTGGIAHDFNNLLAGISGSLELLEKRMGEGRLSGMERYISAAQGAARRAAALTQRLLAFSRRQTLDPKPVDVNRLIAGMEDLVRRSVGPDVEVEVVGSGGLWITRIDPSQLENALLNLCINSRDAMAPNGGRLTIETANKWLDERAARERDLPPGQYISLCVTDTGTGMSPEVQAQAFDPFFTTKPLGQGTGLGLSMIHGFVRQSGGQVRIYSEPGQGTTVCLYLPRHMGELDAPEEAAATGLGADGGHGETVLVIDDEPTVRMLIVEVLEEAGYIAIEAADGPSGLAILNSDTRIDLLITDVGLPGGLNGRQVADAARLTRPDLKVLFITGYAENAAVGNGLLDAGMQVITKPFAMAAMAVKVREMIET